MTQSKVTPTGAEGVWRVQFPDDIHDTVVYLYSTGLWRCRDHPGRRDCRHIAAAQAYVAVHATKEGTQ